MPCCKAEEYGWCNEQDTVYTDEEGNKYCVFHAPEKKGQTPDNYNKLIFKRIQEAIDEKRECNLSGTIFPYSIEFYHFHKDNPFPQISFINATFSGEATFSETTFNERASFDYATFSGYASFRETTFNGDAGFDYATFSGNAGFYKATFNNANFNGATFCENAGFHKATFSESATFYGATFSGRADFDNSIFNDAHFEDATFSGDAGFFGATFSGDADFDYSIFNNAKFNGATFSSDTVFIKAKFVGEIMFINAKFKQKSSFRNCKVDHRMYFENVDLSSASFLDTDIKNMIFQSCTWSKKNNYGRNMVIDELDLKDKKSENKLLAYEKVEDLYRKLKNKYKAENNEPEVSNWHYGEKEMFRKKMNWRRFNPVSFSTLYWASSGYGERPIRAGIVLILLFASVTILMNIFGLISASGQEIFGVKIIKGFSGVIEWKKFWLLIYNTIQNSFFIKDTFFKPQTLAGVIILTITTKLIIPIQAALFVLALRNKFRR